MKVRELISLLQEISPEADIFLDANPDDEDYSEREMFDTMIIMPVTESCDDPTVIGYVVMAVSRTTEGKH